MPDISDQLRNWSKRLADATPAADIETITSPSTTTDASTSGRRWLAVAASVIVVTGGILAIAVLRDKDSGPGLPATNTAPIDTNNSPATPTSPPITEPVSPSSSVPGAAATPDDRFEAWPAKPTDLVPIDDVPRFLPAMQIPVAGIPVRAESGGGSAAPATFSQVFADAERDIVITLQTRPVGSDSTPAELRQPVAIEGWDDSYTTRDDLPVVASDVSGFVRLTGTGIGLDEAVSIIETMRRRPDGIPGWDLSDLHGDLLEINGAWIDSAAQRLVTWFDGDRVVAQMVTSPSYTQFANMLGNSFDKVDASGADGWLNSTDRRRTIVWSPDGTTIAVLAVVDDSIDPLATAQSVDEFGVAEYESLTTTEIPAGVGDGCDGGLFC